MYTNLQRVDISECASADDVVIKTVRKEKEYDLNIELEGDYNRAST